MRLTLVAALLVICGGALAQTPPPLADTPETVYSEAQRDEDLSLSRRTIDAVLTPPDSIEGQFARWRRPICINVYGLAPLAKLAVERRIRQIAEQVGAPLDRADPCTPTVLIAFTDSPRETLDSIARVRPWLTPNLGLIRSRVKESQPIQAWYAIMVRDAIGYRLEYDGYSYEPPSFSPWQNTHLHSGLETQIAAATIVVENKAILGMNLGTLADHFALLALAQGRDTDKCKPVQTIANLMRSDCAPDHQAQELTVGDMALLTGLYATPDDRMQRLQKIRIIGNMTRTLEAQTTSK